MLSTSKQNNGFWRTIFWSGLLAGTLDIGAALGHYYLKTGKDPMRVMNFIASGVFGTRAFTGGTSMIFWGFLFHFMIAYAITIVFFLLYPRLSILSWNVAVTAVILGIAAWLATNLVIVPLSRTPDIKSGTEQVITGMAILVLCIGLPLSIMAKRYYKRDSAFVEIK
jgi:hypothetical protein